MFNEWGWQYVFDDIKYVKSMYKIWWSVSKICYIIVKTMLYQCQKYVDQMPKICCSIIKNMLLKCKKYVITMSKICYSNVNNM